jgi:hypothetical protein
VRERMSMARSRPGRVLQQEPPPITYQCERCERWLPGDVMEHGNRNGFTFDICFDCCESMLGKKGRDLTPEDYFGGAR